MKWEKLSLLIDQIASGIEEQKYFRAVLEGSEIKVEQLQNGVFRTNCMDCLDRTNVV